MLSTATPYKPKNKPVGAAMAIEQALTVEHMEDLW